MDPAGNLFIADSGNHAVREIAVDGTITTVAGNGNRGYSGDGGSAKRARLNTPTAVAVDAKGNLYIADTGNDRIRMVDTRGIIRTVAGTGKNLYAGNGGPAVRANLYAPVGIAVGPGGNVYFSERYQNTIRVITPGGVIGLVAGRGGVRGDGGDGGAATRAKLNDPQGIAFDDGGELYVADTGNRRVRVVTPGGSITTII